MRRATRMPDLSRAKTDEKPVLLNGMRVMFDHKVALYPVNLEEKPSDAQPGANGSRERN